MYPVTQPCPALFDSLDGSLPDSSVRGILQARTLEWVATSSSRGSSRPRSHTHVSCIDRQILPTVPPRKPTYNQKHTYIHACIYLHIYSVSRKSERLYFKGLVNRSDTAKWSKTRKPLVKCNPESLSDFGQNSFSGAVGIKAWTTMK